MLSIDEAIAKYKEIVNTDANCPAHCNISCDKCVDESKQLAEWLEELKAIKNGLNIKCDSLNEALEKGKKVGYNNAIEDFIRKCEMESRVILDEITHLSYYGLSMRELQRIAEQLR